MTFAERQKELYSGVQREIKQAVVFSVQIAPYGMHTVLFALFLISFVLDIGILTGSTYLYAHEFLDCHLRNIQRDIVSVCPRNTIKSAAVP